MNLRKIDALVAEHVFDILVIDYDEMEGYHPVQRVGLSLKYKDIPYYSSDISAAWEVVELMESQGWNIVIYNKQISSSGVVMFKTSDTIEVLGDNIDIPLAIALAALKTKGIDYENPE